LYVDCCLAIEEEGDAVSGPTFYSLQDDNELENLPPMSDEEEKLYLME
jgi:hypothetical protein